MGEVLADRQPAEFVRSLERGLSVIRAFSGERSRLTLSEVAHEVGLPRATARRFLLTLAHLEYLGTDGTRFWLRPRTLDLGYAYLSSLHLWEIAQPSMEALVAAVHESSSVTVLDRGEIVYVARQPTKRIMTIALAVGSRLPAHATSMGRVLLAELDDADLDRWLHTYPLTALTGRTVIDSSAFRSSLAKVRRQGYALVDQELEDGVRSIAVPLRDRAGSAVAAINVAGHASRTTLRQLRSDVLPVLRATAAEISSALSRR